MRRKFHCRNKYPSLQCSAVQCSAVQWSLSRQHYRHTSCRCPEGYNGWRHPPSLLVLARSLFNSPPLPPAPESQHQRRLQDDGGGEQRGRALPGGDLQSDRQPLRGSVNIVCSSVKQCELVQKRLWKILRAGPAG